MNIDDIELDVENGVRLHDAALANFWAELFGLRFLHANDMDHGEVRMIDITFFKALLIEPDSSTENGGHHTIRGAYRSHLINQRTPGQNDSVLLYFLWKAMVELAKQRLDTWARLRSGGIPDAGRRYLCEMFSCVDPMEYNWHLFHLLAIKQAAALERVVYTTTNAMDVSNEVTEFIQVRLRDTCVSRSSESSASASIIGNRGTFPIPLTQTYATLDQQWITLCTEASMHEFDAFDVPPELRPLLFVPSSVLYSPHEEDEIRADGDRFCASLKRFCASFPEAAAIFESSGISGTLALLFPARGKTRQRRERLRSKYEMYRADMKLLAPRFSELTYRYETLWSMIVGSRHIFDVFDEAKGVIIDDGRTGWQARGNLPPFMYKFIGWYCQMLRTCGRLAINLFDYSDDDHGGWEYPLVIRRARPSACECFGTYDDGSLAFIVGWLHTEQLFPLLDRTSPLVWVSRDHDALPAGSDLDTVSQPDTIPMESFIALAKKSFDGVLAWWWDTKKYPGCIPENFHSYLDVAGQLLDAHYQHFLYASELRTCKLIKDDEGIMRLQMASNPESRFYVLDDRDSPPIIAHEVFEWYLNQMSLRVAAIAATRKLANRYIRVATTPVPTSDSNCIICLEPMLSPSVVSEDGRRFRLSEWLETYASSGMAAVSGGKPSPEFGTLLRTPQSRIVVPDSVNDLLRSEDLHCHPNDVHKECLRKTFETKASDLNIPSGWNSPAGFKAMRDRRRPADCPMCRTLYRHCIGCDVQYPNTGPTGIQFVAFSCGKFHRLCTNCADAWRTAVAESLAYHRIPIQSLTERARDYMGFCGICDGDEVTWNGFNATWRGFVYAQHLNDGWDEYSGRYPGYIAPRI